MVPTVRHIQHTARSNGHRSRLIELRARPWPIKRPRDARRPCDGRDHTRRRDSPDRVIERVRHKDRATVIHRDPLRSVKPRIGSHCRVHRSRRRGIAGKGCHTHSRCQPPHRVRIVHHIHLSRIGMHRHALRQIESRNGKIAVRIPTHAGPPTRQRHRILCHRRVRHETQHCQYPSLNCLHTVRVFSLLDLPFLHRTPRCVTD